MELLPVDTNSTLQPANLTICRVCAVETENNVPIYGDVGLANALPDKINKYLPIKVDQEDTLPLYLCWSCISTISAWQELYDKCLNTDKHLKDIKFNEKGEEEQSTDSTDFFDADESQLESLTTYESKADMVPEVASLKTLCQMPLLKPVEDDAESLIDKEITWERTAAEIVPEDESDVTTESTNAEAADVEQSENQTEDDYVVDLCDWLIESEDKTAKSYMCQLCGVFVGTEHAIINHIKTAHSNKYNVIKKERRKNTKLDKDVVNAAKVVVEGKTYYHCKICRKSLHSPYTYMWHMRIHTGERPFVCDLCGKQFRVSQGLIRHLKETHERIKNFPCDLCGRLFSTKRNVEEHRHTHTNERPYVCDLCGKSFKQKASLFVHSRSHTDHFPFKCSYCNQSFRTRTPLLIHMTRHTGEKPYPCEVCGRRFRIKYELKRHRLIHSDDKPFVCQDCGMCFRQKRYLKNHAKVNHNRDLT